MTDLPRRVVLKVSLALSGVLTLAGLLRFLGYQSAPAAPTRFALKSPADYPAGSATSISEAKAWLFRDEAGLYAVSTVCTHLGCTATYADAQFDCPCHGSRFNQAGFVLRGPARLPLPHFQLTLSAEGRVVLNTTVEVPASERLS
jgi:cytochrome b6-f complex iron-sulfur subunit